MFSCGVPTAEVRDDLLLALYRGTREEPHWTTFLDGLSACTGADYASMVFVRGDASPRELSVMHTGRYAGSDVACDGGVIADRLSLSYARLELDQPFRLDEIVDLADDGNAEFAQYLNRRGIRCSVVMRVADRKSGSGWVSLGRTGEDFATWVPGFLRGLAPHLRCAIESVISLDRERLFADIANQVIHRLSVGWLTLDARARVVDIDADLERLFTVTEGLPSCVRGRVLPVGGSGPRRQLYDAVSRITGDAVSPPQVIRLLGDPRLDVLLAPISKRPTAGAQTPVAVGYVRGSAATGQNRTEHMIQLFGLTRSEARLALALCDGKTIAEAASAMKLTIETARNYSKKIYAKTETRGRSELIKVILEGVVALS
jgi:DNA-binding CsgD family transcriptional regulator